MTINTMPNEIENPIPFDQDEEHRSYDREYANRFWRVLVQSDRVFKEFRSRFCGKCSPVHFFWGSFDLAVTRFSGRPAPPHPGGDSTFAGCDYARSVLQEVSSLGFWPGNAAAPTPIFYSYAYPEPAGFARSENSTRGSVLPTAAPRIRQLHMWTQIVGKIRLTLSPWINHSWHVTLYVTSRGLTTSPIPHGTSTFEIRFDFIDHELRILKSDGAARVLKLRPQSVAKFYREVMNALAEMELPVTINMTPNEIENPIPFDQDEEHRSYDREYANRFWRVLVQSDRVFKEFRSRFCGKCSPVHFFWGSFDLAVTRFSGRPAPPHPGGIPHLPDAITREAYSRR